ncbi:NmrA family NAD(P)-binding protein [Clavibacter michiganensis]|uniref:NmrA family NAD(P)-binding protein n=1 Tax=Clavibacter michiganensis TaxID=28447 RepID=UPI0005BAFFC9|nr:NAD(P)H-binding protein [Clavibacter michiganensis]
MYVIAGATGRVGGAVAGTLLEDGAGVRVLVRRPADAGAWRARGAEAHVVDLGDRDGVGRALDGSTGFFVLLPFTPTADDLDAHADALIASITGAVADARVPHVVALSSGGADLPAGTGPIAGLHRLEQALRSTPAVVTALRPCHFQEKVLEVLDAATNAGVYPVLAHSADDPVPMVAASDVGAVAARCLLDPPRASEAVDVVGPSSSEREVASALGAALGRHLHVQVVPEADWGDSLTSAGIPSHVARCLVELHRADAQGLLAPRGDRSVHVTTGITSTVDRLLRG